MDLTILTQACIVRLNDISLCFLFQSGDVHTFIAMNKRVKRVNMYFLYTLLKNEMYYGNTCGERVGWWRPQGFRSLSQRVFSRFISNLVNMLVGHYNQQNPPYALLNYGPWIVQNEGLRSLSQRVFIRSLSNLVNMLVGIIFWPSSITCQIPPGTPELWPWIVQKLN